MSDIRPKKNADDLVCDILWKLHSNVHYHTMMTIMTCLSGSITASTFQVITHNLARVISQEDKVQNNNRLFTHTYFLYTQLFT